MLRSKLRDEYGSSGKFSSHDPPHSCVVNKTFGIGELELAPPFQRNPVWTLVQKAYLINTILHGLPIPELYMLDVTAEDGTQSALSLMG